jgi:murein DD-endopeptidase MepM/ murein hydrolase activator NlpD
MRIRASVAALVSLGVLAPASTLVDVSPPVPSPLRHAEILVRRGDSLERALRRDVAAAEVRGLLDALRGVVDPRRLRPGDSIRLTRTADGALARVSYWPSRLGGHEVRRDGGTWSVRPVAAPVETQVRAVAAGLEGSLFATLAELGEAPELSTRVVELFEWDFDFAADCLPSDRFRLLVEKRYVEGEFVGYGEVLAAQYESAERPVLTAVGFRRPDGTTAHYDLEGRSVRKAFLRAPLEFSRITSGYTHARLHPILGGLRPHLAVDYAAPAGTPVRAVADGVVERAGWDGGNGLSVRLRHPHGYRTLYNHLSRLGVRAGQRVAQRDVIGRVGSTGLSTGPHLDYRVMKDGQWVNPLGERFVPGDPVPDAERPAFEAEAEMLLARLAREAPYPAEPAPADL